MVFNNRKIKSVLMIKKFILVCKKIRSAFVCVKKNSFWRENPDMFWWLKEIDFGL